MKEKIKKKLIVLACALALTGCSKEQDNIPASVEKESNAKTLTIRVSGVSSIENESAQLQSRASGAKQSGSTQVIKQVIEEREGFDVQTNTTEEIDDHDAFAQASSASELRAGTSSKAASSAIESNVKYRVVLYALGPDNAEIFHSSHLFSGAEDQKISIQENTNYNWYAYSYNSDVEPADIISEENPVVEVENVDFIYANGTVSLTEENNIINIQFERKTAMVEIAVDARGMFVDEISALSVDLPPGIVYGATLDLKTGDTLSTRTLSFMDLQHADFSIGYNIMYNTTYKGILKKRFYTAKEKSIAGQIFRLNSFQVKGVGNDPDASNTFPNANTIYNTAPIENVFGAIYRFKLNLIQSALEIEGTKFARGNLYDANRGSAGGFTVGGHRYRFRYQNDSEVYDPSNSANVNNTYDELFCAGCSRASRNDGEWGTVDPCRYVYPEEVWRTPTKEQLQKITRAQKLAVTDYHGIAIAATGAGSPYPNNQLYLSTRGFAKNNFGNNNSWQPFTPDVGIYISSDLYYRLYIRPATSSDPLGTITEYMDSSEIMDLYDLKSLRCVRAE